MPAWASGDTAAPEFESGPVTATPTGLGCAGCGVTTATRWQSIGAWLGHPRHLCGDCSEDLAAADHTRGSRWRDRLVCRAAGLLPGSGYADLAHRIGFRAFAELERDGAGTDAPFGYLGGQLRRLAAFARLEWPESLADAAERAKYTAAKAEREAAKRAKHEAVLPRGTLKLNLLDPR